MPPKRHQTTIDAGNAEGADATKPKKLKTGLSNAEEFILREFYPPEIDNARCEAYNNGELERPIETLQRAIEETADQRKAVTAKSAVVHWFKSDLRLYDNRALHKAYETAKENSIPLICLFILSPQDLTAHLSSAARVDFTLRNLKCLQNDLGRLDIPLYIETQEKRRSIPGHLIELCQKWGANHIFCNIEYEVDELRREAKLLRLCSENGIAFEPVHDVCVVPPGELCSKQGKQYAVFKPFYQSWLAHLKENPQELEILDKPGPNAGNARQAFANIFDCKIPEAPANKQLSEQERAHFKDIYPESEAAAHDRLQAFLSEKAANYDNMRDSLSAQATSVLSPYLSSGVLNPRQAVVAAKDKNGGHLDKKGQGYVSWIREIAFRDFYKHVLVHWPFICMNKCFHPEFTNINWEYDNEAFHAWCVGKTGFPIVDAAMRQLNHDAWMHNRARMIVSSFLSKDLMIDWRMGERYFMEHLIDGDFASNHGGWGYGSSTGVDPQPYFRIFNPLRQSEKFDPGGEHIRRWVPELREFEGSTVHDPYGRGAAATAQKNGYPKPMVDHAASRERALERYKAAAANG